MGGGSIGDIRGFHPFIATSHVAVITMIVSLMLKACNAYWLSDNKGFPPLPECRLLLFLHAVAPQ